MSSLAGLSPSDYGIEGFPSWRPIQTEAIEQAVYGTERFQALALPTGAGKSLTVFSIAKITGYRTVILTGTLGLQDQYSKEFGVDVRASNIYRRMGAFTPPTGKLIDIRGKSNYRCNQMGHADCEVGARLGCGMLKADSMPSMCTYQQALADARNSPVLTTNYKFWLNINRPGSSWGLGLRPLRPNPIDLLILDESHLAPEELASFLAIQVFESEIKTLLHIAPPESDDIAEWKSFAKQWRKTVATEVASYTGQLIQMGAKATKADIEHVRKLEALKDKLDRLHALKPQGWVCERHGEGKGRDRWAFECIWPGAYAESVLFKGIPHVVLVSATLRPKTLGLLGIPTAASRFREWPRVFPANRCPVYHIPTIKLNYRTTSSELSKWVEQIDNIIESRMDRKGIIHTVSYDRQRYLFAHSRYAHLMIGNTNDPASPRAAEIVHQFKEAPAPSVLCSPSFSTGWDFPGRECEWIIIAKVPFPHSQSKVMQARVQRDPKYLSYLAMQDLIQSCGRGMRSAMDRCETFIVDDSILWFLNQNKALKPKWFELRPMAKLPAPPPALTA